MNYYEVLGIEPRLKLDLDDLRQRFYRLSRQLHPDLAPREERARAEEATAALNDAYRTLRNSLDRGEYYLKLKGFEPGDERRVPPELLSDVFELNEALEAGDDSARPRIQEGFERFLMALSAADAEIETLFAAVDSGDPDAPRRLRAALDRRRYISKLLARVPHG